MQLFYSDWAVQEVSNNSVVEQSVGLHDEINSIIAIVGLCSLSEQW